MHESRWSSPAVRTGDSNQSAIEKAIGQLNFAPYRNIFFARRAQQRSVCGNARTRDHQILMRQSGFRMRAKLQRDAFFAQAERLRPKLAFRVRVRSRDGRARLGAKARRGDTGTRQSDDQNMLAAQLESACHCSARNLSPILQTFGARKNSAATSI